MSHFHTSKYFTKSCLSAFIVVTILGLTQVQAQDLINSMPPSNVVQLSSQGSVEVQQDLLRITLSTTKQGKNAQQVQTQLKQALDAALKITQRSQKGKELQVQTGQFSVYPVRNRNQKISSWQGRVSLILSGTNIARVSSLASKISSLTIANTSFGISPELRKKTVAKAQAAAIINFREKATTITRQFGFSQYNLRSVTVQSEDNYGERMMHYEADAASLKSSDNSAPIPTQPGKDSIRVQVHGSVQMQ